MATQSNNFILIERDASSPIRGQQRSIDAADDIVLAPATVSIAPSGNVAINSSGGTLSMGNASSTQAINIGTAGARIVTIGQGVGTGPTIVLDGVTNTTQIESNGVLAIGSNYVGIESIYIGSGNLGVFAQTRTINIGNSTSGTGVNLYAGTSSNIALVGPIQLSSATSQITISSTSGSINIDGTTTGTINLGANGGTGAINIGTAATNRAITIGNATNTSAFTINAGNGGIILSTNATASGAIQIGADNGNGQISIGTGTGSRTVSIGTGAANGSINIGTNASTGRTVTVGNSTGTSRLVLTGGSGTTAGSEAIAIGNDAGTGTIVVASSTGTRTVVIAGGTAAQTVSIGAGGAAKTVTLGSTTSTSATTIQTGTGAMTLTAGGIYDVNATGAVTIDSSTSTISIGSDNVAQQVRIGNAGARKIFIGSTSATGIELGAGAGGIVVNNIASVALRGMGQSCFNGAGTTIPAGAVVALQANPTIRGTITIVAASANSATAAERIPLGAANQSIGSGSFGDFSSVPGLFAMVLFDLAPANTDVGNPVYLSSTAGIASLTAPSASGQTIYRIGYLSHSTAFGGLYKIIWQPQFIADIP